MIIFHEGMPRSGKSYAAMKDHIIPALSKGRIVYSRLDGIEHKQIAELAGIEEDRCRELLLPLTEEQCLKLPEQQFAKDSLIVIDEAQNYWQAGRAKLAPELLKWIAEHGHHGHDVLLMGQLLKDVHSSWMNRVNRKVTFIKKDVVGKANEYKWIMYHGAPDNRGNVKFREVSRGDEKYDDRYFGTYKSHSEGTENKATYADDRANIFRSKVFRKWLPLYSVAALAALVYVVWAFSGGLAGNLNEKAQKQAVKEKPKPESFKVETKPGELAQVEYQQGKPVDLRPVTIGQSAPISEPADFIDDLNGKYRIRLGGSVRGERRAVGFIEWRDTDLGVKERLSFVQLQGLGWLVMISTDGGLAILQKGSRRVIASAWPIEDQRGRVTEAQTAQIKPEEAPVHRGGVIAAPAPNTLSPSPKPDGGGPSTNPKFAANL